MRDLGMEICDSIQLPASIAARECFMAEGRILDEPIFHYMWTFIFAFPIVYVTSDVPHITAICLTGHYGRMLNASPSIRTISDRMDLPDYHEVGACNYSNQSSIVCIILMEYLIKQIWRGKIRRLNKFMKLTSSVLHRADVQHAICSHKLNINNNKVRSRKLLSKRDL